MPNTGSQAMPWLQWAARDTWCPGHPAATAEYAIALWMRARVAPAVDCTSSTVVWGNRTSHERCGQQPLLPPGRGGCQEADAAQGADHPCSSSHKTTQPPLLWNILCQRSLIRQINRAYYQEDDVKWLTLSGTLVLDTLQCTSVLW